MNRFLSGLIVLSACAQLEGPIVPVVTTAGPHSAHVGESVQLTASTKPKGDDSYVWSSADPTIAHVDDTGLVTGMASGETMLSAKGNPSGAIGQHAMVVFVSAIDAGAFVSQVPFFTAWSASPHADIGAKAFTHWNAEGKVPVACARCHSSEGFIDYLGGDGTAAGRVDAPGETGSVIRCITCHDPSATALTSVMFPSGKVVSGLGPEARCIVCHQGRASGLDVDRQIADAGVGEDVESALLGSTNIHYFPAAATLFAGQAMGGYQYADHFYDTKFRHVPAFDTCTQCHDPHSTKVRWAACATCHDGVTDVTQAHDIRQIASRNQDYDGDGNTTEGIYYEVQGIGATLLKAMQRYSAERNQPLCYSTSYPLWFNDVDGDGACTAAETVSKNAFKHWSPRLQKAAYNYQLAKTDRGGFAHNAKYTIQLLSDSVASMNGGLVTKLDTSRMVRDDPGHFNGASEVARRWDANDAVAASCSRCHSGSQGFRFFTQYGVGQNVPQTPNGLECATCHETFAPDYTLSIPAKTFLAEGKTVVLPGNDNLCANCHIGRASKATIDAAIAVGGNLRFINVHYLPAAGTREGSLAKVGYQYDGKTYAGRLQHMGGVQCTSCHDPKSSNHTFKIADVWASRCETCHADQAKAEEVRLVHVLDYDGDGNTTETLAAEIDGMAARLMTAMQTATANGLCYSGVTYPYFFKDTDANGRCDAPELVSSNGFASFTPALLKAAHNYQMSRKDPGAWAHNFDYVGQLLFDSIENVSGAAPVGVLRPL